MNKYALLTGRGNNSLPGKNVLPVFGKPLLTYCAVAAKKVLENNNLFVSSDDRDILEAAANIGYTAILRPKELSGPDAQHIDAILHGLNVIESVANESVDILVVMLANSATIKSEWIAEAINMIENDPSITSVVPVYKEQDHHPFRAKKIDNEGKLVPYFDFEEDFVSTNRQDLSANYFLSHNFWVLNVNKSIKLNDGFKPWTFLGKKTMPIFVEGCFDVHTMEDIEKTKVWLKANKLD